LGTILIRNARRLVTMDDERRELESGALFIRDGVIEAVGAGEALLTGADRIIDARDHVVMPGLVNTHHHCFQSLTRALPAMQNAGLFHWLTGLYPIWSRLTPEMAYESARTVLCEMLLSGCTTTTDQLYLYPNGVTLDDTIRAAGELGVRFHPCRGSMSMGQSDGGLPPDDLVEDAETVLRDSRRVIETYHQAGRYGMVRIALAPAAPFNVSEALIRESAALARAYGVHLHTHVAETQDEEAYCLERVGVRPTEYMRRLGWVGPDVWWAHAIWLNGDDVALLAETGTGVAHCPGSNMRLGSGIAPVREYLDAGVRVGLAVDGSASNDSAHLLGEARLAMLLQRVGKGPDTLSAREALAMATRGGAAVLGRDDIGVLAPGMAADVIGVRVDDLAHAGAQEDPVAALLFCTPAEVDFSIINGRIVVEDGALVGVDLAAQVARHNALSQRLLAG
jgi:cytosine/adenosine deaminase-related metal-dependent hydrolase